MNKPLAAALFFLPQDNIDRITPLGSGNVNDTWLVTLHSGVQRVLQRLNPAVFPDPMLVMHNTRRVCDHLLQTVATTLYLKSQYQPVKLFAGISGDAYLDAEGGAWRMMDMITGCRTLHRISSPNQAKELGRTLGLFHKMLATLDPDTLGDPLPGFHHTPQCLKQYDQIISASRQDREPENDFCRNFIAQRRSMVNLLQDSGEPLGRGIIHGDPKVANFLFDGPAEKVITLIDLDTVQPGLILHDLGDALRSCCNTAGETPDQPKKTVFDAQLFHDWLSGYLGEAGFLLTDADRVHIVDAVRLITFELGLRFYTDFLAGNHYFKVSSSEQNLHRAMTQFHLVQSIDQQAEKLNELVKELTAAAL